jgi:hypothetical protein
MTGDVALYLFLWFFICVIGYLIGAKKDRPLAGLAWAFMLGPLGWLLIWLLPAPRQLACPHCLAPIAFGEPKCAMCMKPISWIRRKPVRPSRAAERVH